MPSLTELDLAHLFHPVTNLKRHRELGPLILVEGRGVRVRDEAGRWYLDGFAGLWNVNLGHGREELAQAAAEQMRQLAFQPTFFGLATPPAIELAAELAEWLPHHSHFQFTSGGAESNETAIKVARYYWAQLDKPEKVKILSRRMAYHGIAMGALAATGIPAYHQDFGPIPPGFIHLSPPYAYRQARGSEEEFVKALAEELEATIEREGTETIAAMIAEPVQGAGGVVVPPEGYWSTIAPILKAHQILLIADEVITGFGRTGRNFGQETYGIQADLTTMAKGITSGYVPLGAVGVRPSIYEVISAPDRTFMHGFTYSGHPVACAVALANLELLKREGVTENARARGEELVSKLKSLEALPHVGETRGKGLMAFIEVVEDKTSKKPFDPSFGLAYRLQKATRERGVIVRCQDSGIAIAPPLVIRQEEVDELVNALGEALEAVFRA